VTTPSREPAERKTTDRCPICGKPAAHAHRPFCGKRCAEIDLGRWLKGAYAVPGEPTTGIDDGNNDGELD
jgi:endogenous inhibitor of DNA gyrase (YacG/DUF329 family)